MYRSSTWMSRPLALLVAFAVLFAPVVIPTAFAQDALSQARTHYQKGTSLFSSGDYKGAIAEYAEADRLAPSAMLEYNIALCYDRLGDRGEALRRYRVYLREMPNAQNRGSVEGKIRRLEGEIRQDSERRRREAEAAAAVAAAKAPAPAPVPAPVPDPVPVAVNPEDIVIPRAPVPAPVPAPTGTGLAPAEVYTPDMAPAQTPDQTSAPTYANRNDPEFARVAAIDVAAIRDQRGATSAGAVGYQAEQVPPRQDMPVQDDGNKKKASKPIYKQWWFWVVAGVGTIILIDFATSDSSEPTNQRLMLGPQMQSGAPAPGGLEWRF